MKAITVKKSTLLKFMIIVLSLLLVAAAATAVYFGVQYSKTNDSLAKANEDLAKANDDIKWGEVLLEDSISKNQSLIEQNSSEKQSYEDKISQENSEHQSEVDKLNGQIDKLKKELAAKTTKTTVKSTTKAPAKDQSVALPNPKPSAGKTVYLTFDDGPSQYTPEILNVLDKYGVKATFFVVNGKYNGTMKKIVDRGHQIGLHTYTHNYEKVYASDSAYFADLQKIHDVVLKETGVDTKIIRFPGGSSNTVSKKYSKGIMSRVTKAVGEKGYVYFDWNCTNGDAEGAATVQKQLEYCAKFPKSASRIIVLMHDTKKTTLEALPKIIEYYQSCGMTFDVLTPFTTPVHHNVLN